LVFDGLLVGTDADVDRSPFSHDTLRCLPHRISDYFGDLRTAQFDRPEKIRPVIRRWRSQWADKRRTADYGMQVLSRVLAYAVELGKIAGNPCQGIKQLYTVDRSELIWTDADQKQLFVGSERRPCPQEIIDAVDLASHTGLRLGDLLRLSWSHVGEDAIELTTGKSKHKRLDRVVNRREDDWNSRSCRFGCSGRRFTARREECDDL
jgi:integrase